MDISQYFIKGDIKGAITYMSKNNEFKDILPHYQALFEREEYLIYPIASILNESLLQYQIYFHDIFYKGIPEEEASRKLLSSLYQLMDATDEDSLVNKLKEAFKKESYESQFGKTQGFYGPYIWKETVPAIYHVDLIDSSADYKVNILKGFIFKGWMNYLTFGRFGTRGWASADGTINCIEDAYDFESEKFKVSLLKHEAQHAVDMKLFPKITATELEYRAKLTELYFTSNPLLLNDFIMAATTDNPHDSHGLASAKIKREFASIDTSSISSIHNKALALFETSTREMKEKYL